MVIGEAILIFMSHIFLFYLLFVLPVQALPIKSEAQHSYGHIPSKQESKILISACNMLCHCNKSSLGET